MEIKGKPFTLLKQKGRSPYWYVKFKNPETMKFDPKSKVISSKKKLKSEAEKWGWENYLEYVKPSQAPDNFEAFTKDFFTTTSSWYINRDKPIYPVTLKTYENIFRKDILPFFKDYNLKEINKLIMREFRTKLAQIDLLAGSKNLRITLLSFILKEAEKQGRIDNVPTIDQFPNKSRIKGILSTEEINRLFHIEWRDYRAFVANLLMACSGMRVGEVLSLRPCDVDFNREIIIVRRSFNTSVEKQKEQTKTGKTRVAPVPTIVMNEIKKLLTKNPYSGDDKYIFYSAHADKPMDYDWLAECVFRSKFPLIPGNGFHAPPEKYLPNV